MPLDSSSVIVRKDIIAPVITITQPNDYDLYGITAPPLSVNFNDANLDSRWYELDDGTTTAINYTWTGFITQSDWNQMANGTVSITIYANDTMGNQDSSTVIVRKDIIAPIITINQPNDYDLFGATVPFFLITTPL